MVFYAQLNITFISGRYKQTGRQTGRQADRQRHRDTDRQTQTDVQETESLKREINKKYILY